MTGRELQTVMIVEDNDDIRDVLRMSLEAIGGLQVNACASGGEALERLQDDLPDLVLLDWMMPTIDGSEVMARMRADPRTSGLPVVVLTGKALPAEMDAMREMGAVDVIAKPFDALTLAERLSGVFRALGD